MAKRSQWQLVFAAEEWREVEAVRQDHSAHQRERVAHAARSEHHAAVCGVDVVHAAPQTAFADQFIIEQWGPIRRCERCPEALGVNVD